MSEKPEKESKSSQEFFAELAQRALIQAGDLQALEEKLKDIVDRTARPQIGERTE